MTSKLFSPYIKSKILHVYHKYIYLKNKTTKQYQTGIFFILYSIQSDQQQAVFYAGISEGTIADWDKVWQEMVYTMKEDYREALLYGLSAAKEPWVALRYGL